MASTKKDTLKIGTLFSGIGSPEQAAKRVYGDEFELVFACELDKYARESYKANYDIEDEQFHKDINDLDGTKYAGEVDIIIGGSPCQDFSIAGLKAGVAGHRGQLIWQYFRIINEIKPAIFIYENVKGMLSDKKVNKKDKFGQTFKDFLAVFESIGYHLKYQVLNTRDYGVPQNRERIYIVGFLDEDMRDRFEFAPKIKLEKAIRDILEDEVDEKYYLDRARFGLDVDGIARTLRTGGKSSDTKKHCWDLIKVATLDIKGNDSIKRVYSPDGCAPCLTTMGGGHREPKITDSYRIRKQTPRECFRLQDFPDDFKFVVSNTQLYKQAGNAMSVNVVEMILRYLKGASDGSR